LIIKIINRKESMTKMNKKLPDIFNIRKALEDFIEEKLKGNVTDVGTWLDFSGADVAFELKGKRYNIEINDITKEEDNE
tara:strand:- start:418 stop:654 length:237 start_codon:yes stop_codon:yes gene_type:complete